MDFEMLTDCDSTWKILGDGRVTVLFD